MNYSIMNKNDEMVMALIHYFITEENYTPIVVRGTKDEVWLENLEGPYRIIRINSNYIHNKEQLDFDIFKTSKVIAQIRKKTLSFNMNALNILLNVSDNVEVEDNKYISSIKIKEIDKVTDNNAIVELFPKIKNKLIKDKAGLDLIVNVTNDINAKTLRDNETYAKIFSPKKSIITPILIAINLIIFFLTFVLGENWDILSIDGHILKIFGATSNDLVKSGEVWRLFTAMFLHGGLFHVVVNMYSLWIIGHQIENFLGKWKYLTVYLGSGIIGSLLSSAVNLNMSVGASGAIYGLLGSLLYFGYHYRLYLGTILKTQIIPIIILNLAIGAASSGIDNFAHVGGLVGGYFITMALGVPGKSHKSDQINGIILLTILVAFLIFVIFR